CRKRGSKTQAYRGLARATALKKRVENVENPCHKWRRRALAGTNAVYSTSLTVLSSFRSLDDAPTQNLNSPGSTTRLLSRLISESCSGTTVNFAVLLSPGLRFTRSKPERFSS